MSVWCTAPMELAGDALHPDAPAAARRPAMRGCAGEPLSRPRFGLRHRALLALVPPAAVVLVVLLDAVARSRWDWPLPFIAVLDEPAHLVTALLFLVAFLPGRAFALAPWALAGSVLIDLDHLPLYLWGVLADADGSRPVTHSVSTVAVVVVAGLLTRGRARTALLGLGIGVALHLVRDLATGPGVPLLWPFDPTIVLARYGTYVLVLAVVAVLASVRLLLRTPPLLSTVR
jgi:inner membrane protein